jgi:5'-3' exonuclease
VSELTPEFYEKMCHNYLEGLFWTLSYYFQGHLSWKWYYGYHVAPFVTGNASPHIKFISQDLFQPGNFKLKFDFDMGKPFTPLQQLLAVLPPHSKDLIPPIYQSLMVDTASPIIEFFPNEFEFLLDEKNREWRNIALIPFLDEAKLVEAFNKVEERFYFIVTHLRDLKVL